jgi:dipeptidyl aminopeptidase/acylaminoacyl peptidase
LSKDGSGFYFSSNQRDEMLKIQYYELASQTTSTLVNTANNLEDLRLCNKDKNRLWTENNKGFETLFAGDANGKNARPTPLQRGVYAISCSARDTAMISHSGPASPSTIYSLSPKGFSTKAILFPQMAGIAAKNLVAPKAITFQARDGITIHGLLYIPVKVGDEKPPIVIDIHGGPTSQSKAAWQPLTQYLVGKGIAVLDINVRGSTGYGKTYARLDNQKMRLDSVRDLVDALSWLEKYGRVNGKNAAAIGGSYGGYMVNAVMGAYPDAFKAGTSFVGVANLVRALQTASPGLKASDRIECGDISDKSWQEFYAINSPFNTLGKTTAPMFFQYGVNDPQDPVTESDEMVKALRDMDVPFLMIASL